MKGEEFDGPSVFTNLAHAGIGSTRVALKCQMAAIRRNSVRTADITQ
jgi:hypothetical protein